MPPPCSPALESIGAQGCGAGAGPLLDEEAEMAVLVGTVGVDGKLDWLRIGEGFVTTI